MIESNKNYYISCLFFLFFFIGWGCCYPYLSLWLMPFAFNHYSGSSPTGSSIVKT